MDAFDQTGPGIRTFVRMGKDFDATDADIRAKALVYFDALVQDADKGKTFVINAIDGSAKVAKKAKAVKRIKSNRDILDKYNADNADAIRSVSQNVVAAKTALANALDDFKVLQDAASALLDVDWALDVQLTNEDTDEPRVYVPDDSLGSAPNKPAGKGRGKRTYHYDTGPWHKDVTPNPKIQDWTGKVDGDIPNPIHGHKYSFDASFDKDKAEFTVVVKWQDTKGKSKSHKAVSPLISTAGQDGLIALWADIAGVKRTRKSLPLNLQSTMVDFTKLD